MTIEETKAKVKDAAEARLTILFDGIDDMFLAVVVDEAISDILTDIGTSEIPEELIPAAGKLVAGYYVLEKSGLPKGLAEMSVDSNAAVSSIKEGDVQVNFDSSTGNGITRLRETANSLISSAKNIIGRFRRLTWC